MKLDLENVSEELLAKTMAPQYNHDCDCCVFLGSFVQEGKKYDAWFCSGAKFNTFIARYGSKGHDLISYPSDVLSGLSLNNPVLRVQKMALERGLGN